MVTTRAQQGALRASEVRFTRREVREHTGWGHTQLKVHMQRLEELEYVLVFRGVRGQSYVYALATESDGDAGTTAKRSGWSAPGRPAGGDRSGDEAAPFRGGITEGNASAAQGVGGNGDRVSRAGKNSASYAQATR